MSEMRPTQVVTAVRWLGAACATAAVILAALAAGPAGAGAREPLAYHATVINGDITGSAFQIEDGVALTNAHVVSPLRPGAEVLLALTGAADGRVRQARARLLAVSSRMDLAVLAVPAGFLPVVPAEDAPLRRGGAITAAGVEARPGGPGPRMELAGRIASEILTLRPFGPGLVAEMPGIRRGFSGGPVFAADGRLVGMVAALRPSADQVRSATGTPLVGREAFVLAAPAIRAEAARLLGEVRVSVR